MCPYHNKVCFWLMNFFYSQFTFTMHLIHSVIVFVLRITFGTLTWVKHISLPYTQRGYWFMLTIITSMTCTVHCNDSNIKEQTIDSFSSVVCHYSSHWPREGAVRLWSPQSEHVLSGEGRVKPQWSREAFLLCLRCLVPSCCPGAWMLSRWGVLLQFRAGPCLWRIQPSFPKLELHERSNMQMFFCPPPHNH